MNCRISRLTTWLPGTSTGEARWVGRHVRCGHDIDSSIQLFVDLLTHEVFAVRVVIRQVERATDSDIPLASARTRCDPGTPGGIR